VVAAADVVAETSESGSDPQANLVGRAKEGDEQAFAALFDQHKRRVYSLCLRMTGNVVEAEDLLQDAFIQVFRKLETFRGDATFSTWLYRVVVNTVLMKLRRRRHMREVSLDEPVRLESSLVPRDIGRSDLELMGTIDRIALERAIQELPKGCRTIFMLHEMEGYEHHEIARLLRCSVGNSKSQLHKARLKMRELLFQEATPTRSSRPEGKRFSGERRSASPPRVASHPPPVSPFLPRPGQREASAEQVLSAC
jgi:RNA polymerase sigma-70 factor (ECF subfamily)